MARSVSPARWLHCQGRPETQAYPKSPPEIMSVCCCRDLRGQHASFLPQTAHDSLLNAYYYACELPVMPMQISMGEITSVAAGSLVQISFSSMGTSRDQGHTFLVFVCSHIRELHWSRRKLLERSSC